jgi:hypothetical protein
MLKKLMVFCICYASFALADNIVQDKVQAKDNYNNSPSVGSRSYNNNNYKPLRLQGNENKKYYTESDFKDRPNQPTLTGSSAYSNRSLPAPEIKGEDGKKYYTNDEISKGQNQPSQGSKSFSNKTFPVPEIKDNMGSVSK